MSVNPTNDTAEVNDLLTVATAHSWFFQYTEAGWRIPLFGELEAELMQEIESVEDQVRFVQDCEWRENPAFANEPSPTPEWAEKKIEKIKEKSELKPLQKELVEIEFMSPEELDLRVQTADARKLTACALRYFFIDVLQYIDRNDEAVAALEQMIGGLTEVIDRADQA